MGYHITVNVYNHTRDVLNLTTENDGKGYHTEKGSIEGLKQSLPANTSTAAFTGYHSGSDPISGWVSYGLPNSDFVMNINYGSAAKGPNKSGSVYVQLYNPNDSSATYSVNAEGYVVYIECGCFSAACPAPCHSYSDNGDGDEFNCTVVHLYNSDDVNLPSNIASSASAGRASSQVFVKNNTSTWLHLKKLTSGRDTMTEPSSIQNGSTSLPPGETNMVIDFWDNGETATKSLQLLYSIDQNNAIEIEQESDGDGPAKVPTATLSGEHDYSADVEPKINDQFQYTITISSN